MDLKQALIDEGVASEQEVETAHARSALYGGDLITNLLDIRSIDEKATMRAACVTYGMSPAPSGELPYASAAAIELLPRHSAMSWCIYPFRLDGDVLTVIASEPLPTETEQHLSNTLNVRVRQLLALAPRVRQALARDYAHPVEARVSKALARLEGKQPTPSVHADDTLIRGPSFSKLPHAPSIVPVGFPMTWSEAETHGESGTAAKSRTHNTPMQERREHQAADPLDPPRTTRSGTTEDIHRELETATRGPTLRPTRARRRGPYTASDAKRDLREAGSVEMLVQIYFDFAAQYFDYSAIFAVTSTGAALRDCRALHGAATHALDPQFALDQFPALQEVAATGHWSLVELDDVDRELARELGCEGPGRSVLLPVRVRNKTTLILLGGFEGTDVKLEDVGDLLAFEALMSQAIEREILTKKAGRSSSGPSSALHAESDAVDFEERLRQRPSTTRQGTEALVQSFGNAGAKPPKRGP